MVGQSTRAAEDGHLEIFISHFYFLSTFVSFHFDSSMINGTQVCYVIASMGLQVTWSFMLALLDAYALVRKKMLHNPILVSLFVVGDWVTATLSLAAASASGGVAVLFFSDLGHCNFGDECRKFQISVVLAFLSWITIAVSALIMLWILVAV
ncbi:CASP-like protein 5B3 isoform X2 [Benincasa hispida]|uniref:CASP-like protein 5B3 isoform X2 n=1 Tax=Benincasa hispida TaxID=102211 RepID=UPI001902B4CC|nr:CASP-like protein 5B3 isoform X2 [Benincasa hispida]